jgi:hypothetical protein
MVPGVPGIAEPRPLSHQAQCVKGLLTLLTLLK